jgi:pyruvate/2-oxoglutarate dehydrogenase complex dihydrolipoamide dehydrogenase (E3) component
VALLDYVKPSPAGTVWGLGGTCVNVGCIPKKLMHQAALHSENLYDAGSYGWDIPQVTTVQHSWKVLSDAIKEYIASMNWGYRVQLRENHIDYLNAFGEFIDSHTLKTTAFDKKTQQAKSSVSTDLYLSIWTVDHLDCF